MSVITPPDMHSPEYIVERDAWARTQPDLRDFLDDEDALDDAYADELDRQEDWRAEQQSNYDHDHPSSPEPWWEQR